MARRQFGVGLEIEVGLKHRVHRAPRAGDRHEPARGVANLAEDEELGHARLDERRQFAQRRARVTVADGVAEREVLARFHLRQHHLAQ